MKIGFLGGHKAGSRKSNVAEGYNAKDLPWEIQTEDPNQNTGGFQRTINVSLGREYIHYDLMIMKKNKTLKFFYVLRNMTRDEVENQLNKFWENSDVLGYEFD